MTFLLASLRVLTASRPEISDQAGDVVAVKWSNGASQENFRAGLENPAFFLVLSAELGAGGVGRFTSPLSASLEKT
jgi:hypothetical protein